jgi:hypothetical protein
MTENWLVAVVDAVVADEAVGDDGVAVVAAVGINESDGLSRRSRSRSIGSTISRKVDTARGSVQTDCRYSRISTIRSISTQPLVVSTFPRGPRGALQRFKGSASRAVIKVKVLLLLLFVCRILRVFCTRNIKA